MLTFDSTRLTVLRLEHLVALRRTLCNLLILRAANLCKQGVGGSNPPTSTNQFSSLESSTKSVPLIWCTFWFTAAPISGVRIHSTAARLASMWMCE